MSTCPFPCLESSPTPSHLPKPCMGKISFLKQNLLFLKINYRMSVKYETTLRGENVGELPETVMVLIRNDLLDSLPTLFSGISSYEIHFAIMLVFQKIHVMHSHLISRLPGAYENVLCLFNHFIPIYIICIYSQFYNHTTCNSTISTITQISSFERITISSPMAYTHNYIPYNCDIMLTSQALTY